MVIVSPPASNEYIGRFYAGDLKVVKRYLTSQTLTSSGIKTGGIKVDDQVEKKQDFVRKGLGSFLGRHYTRLNTAANQLKCAKQQIHLHVNMAETLLNCFAEDLPL